MTTVQSFYQSGQGTEDVMEMSTDPGHEFQGGEDLDIDLDLGQDETHSVEDADMTEELNDLGMAKNPDPQGVDARMEDQPEEQNTIYQQPEPISDLAARSAREDTNLTDEGEDLLDEIEDIEVEPNSYPTQSPAGPEESSLAGLPEQQRSYDDSGAPDPALLRVASPSAKDLEGPASFVDDTRNPVGPSTSRAHEDTLQEQVIAGFPTDDSVGHEQTNGSAPAIHGHLGVEQADQANAEEASSTALRSTETNAAVQRDRRSESIDDFKQQELHPVVLQYRAEEYYLFPVGTADHDPSEPILGSQQMAHGGVLNVLDACRARLKDEIPIDHELEMLIEDLGLKFIESNTSFPNISFADVIEKYVELCNNDGVLHPEPLYVRLYVTPVPAKRWEHLLGLAREGLGLSQASVVENSHFYTPDYNAPEDDSESTLNDDGIESAVADEAHGAAFDEEKDESNAAISRSDRITKAGHIEQYSTEPSGNENSSTVQATEPKRKQPSGHSHEEENLTSDEANQSRSKDLPQDASASSLPGNAESTNGENDAEEGTARPGNGQEFETNATATLEASPQVNGVSINQEEHADELKPLHATDRQDEFAEDEDNLDDDYGEFDALNQNTSAGNHFPSHNEATDPLEHSLQGESSEQQAEAVDASEVKDFEPGTSDANHVFDLADDASGKQVDDFGSDQESLLDFEETEEAEQAAVIHATDEEAFIDTADPHEVTSENDVRDAAHGISLGRTSEVAGDVPYSEADAQAQASSHPPSSPGQAQTGSEPRSPSLKRQHQNAEDEAGEVNNGEGVKRLRST